MKKRLMIRHIVYFKIKHEKSMKKQKIKNKYIKTKIKTMV